MSDTSEKRDALTRLIEEEDASAAIEFMVLVPVYILMMTALFMFGNLVLARYTLLHGVRYVAWHPQTSSLGNSFPAIKPYPGTLDVQEKKEGDITWQAGKLQPQGQERSRMGTVSNSASGKAQQIAKVVINNEKGETKGTGIFLNTAEGSFDYSGVVVGGMRIKQDGARAAVYLPKKHVRTEYSSSKKHPAVDWGGSVIDPKTNKPEAFFSPKYLGHFAKEDGIWDVKARIDGSWGSELQFFKPHIR